MMENQQPSRLSVIIPTYNEAKTLPDIVTRVLAVPIEKELIIVDDGSVDETSSILEAYQGRDDIRILRHGFNRGKGAAVQTAIAHVRGDITVIQDADMEYDPQDYLKLVEPITGKETLVVFGTRVRSSPLNLDYYWGSRILTLFTNVLYRQSLHDMNTCYKMFDSNLLKSIPLKCRRFDFDPEVTAKVAKRGLRIREIPIRYRPRSFAEGKKIRRIDGVIQAWTLLKYRFAD
jgi:dolichol-phosphate mannosyltransferase